MQKTRQRPINQSRSTQAGLLLGLLGAAAGTAWCLRNHFGHRSTPLSRSSGHNDQGLLWGGLGAGLAGVILATVGRTPNRPETHGRPRDVRLSSHIIINRPPEEVYQFWKDFRNLPEVMSFIDRVEPQEGNLYHWVARGPAGPTIEWDSEVVDDDPGKLLAWRSVEGSDLQNWGTVLFTRRGDNRGTELSVAFNFTPPEHVTGSVARFLSGLENAALHQNLRNLKSRLETGEVPTSRRFPSGKGSMG